MAVPALCRHFVLAYVVVEFESGSAGVAVCDCGWVRVEGQGYWEPDTYGVAVMLRQGSARG